ncbi:MAG: hypothetical protein KBC49_01015 [Candidatus Pacebacteria bacterium]|nr:hypothetical protein [Candidatus Paceibacterota bacterium]
MVTEELLAYIKRQQANRVPEESIRAILLANGWLKIDVDKAFDSLFKVEESKIVTSQELRTKVASLSPNMTAQARPEIVGQGGDFVSSGSSLAKDSYREPIDNSVKEQFTSKNIGTPMGKELPVDLKERLRKISSDSIFSPEKHIVNPVSPTQTQINPNPFIAQATGSTPSFEEKLGDLSDNATSLEASSRFPIKRETIMSQPLSSLHMIENNSIQAPETPNPNRLYSRFGGAQSPYSPSMDKFNSPLSSVPPKKSHFGIVLFFIFILILAGEGYYLVTYQKPLVQSLIQKLQIRELIEKAKQEVAPEENIQTENTENTQEEPSGTAVNTQTENTTTVPPAPVVNTAESTLKNIATKVSSYTSIKTTTKGVCSNISSGIAKDLIELKNSYGSSATCLDDANGFSVTIPYQTTGEYMCVDASSEIVLVKAIPKTARCI